MQPTSGDICMLTEGGLLSFNEWDPSRFARDWRRGDYAGVS
jgi:hypothetical protein